MRDEKLKRAHQFVVKRTANLSVTKNTGDEGKGR